MSATGVITAQEFDPSKVEFSKLRKNKNGGKAVYINTTQLAKGSKFYLQLPFTLHQLDTLFSFYKNNFIRTHALKSERRIMRRTMTYCSEQWKI